MKSRSILAILLVASSLATGVGGASAFPAGPSKSAVTQPRAFLAEGEAELAPLAHVKFCMANAMECSMETAAVPSSLDAESVATLDRVNREVNRRIRPRAKFATIGEWAISPTSGDCNDYAVTKRHLLVALGLPRSALRLAVVRTRWGEGHLVLVARTHGGDYVLDNLSNRLARWDETGHSFLKIQSAGDARNWAGVGAATSAPALIQMAAAPPSVDDAGDWYLGGP